MTDAATITPGAPSSTHSFIVRQAGVPGERFMLAGVERGVSFAEANDRVPPHPGPPASALARWGG
jgi:hypothetical protein